MGCYDSVSVPCPKCSKEQLFQSKSGSRTLTTYTLDNCPVEVMLDINRHGPVECECGEKFMVLFEWTICNVMVVSFIAGSIVMRKPTPVKLPTKEEVWDYLKSVPVPSVDQLLGGETVQYYVYQAYDYICQKISNFK